MNTVQTLSALTDTYLKYGIVPVGKKKAMQLGLPPLSSATESVKMTILFDGGKKHHSLIYDPIGERFFGVRGWFVKNDAQKGDCVSIEMITPGKIYRFGFVPQKSKPENLPKRAITTANKSPTKSLVGEPINYRGLIYSPVNEQGVVLLFGMVFEELGMIVEEVKTGFPDATIRRFNGKGWVRERVEFEYVSMNFKRHKHPMDGCDIIICWKHDWEECPLEVIDLASFVPFISSRKTQSRSMHHGKK